MDTITPQELNQKIANGSRVDLIDVRTPVEFREVHVTIARNVPLDQLDPQAIAASHGQEEPLYVICRSGSRGKQACEKLAATGLKVFNVDGGTKAWDEAGLPVIRGKKTISLERQVRIAAGFLALLGAVLAMTVNQYWAGLSAFVGAGLMFAGITDTCGMGMLLAKMPWNQVRETTPKSGECRTDAATPAGQGCCS